MLKFKKIFIALFLFIISGCATSEGYNRILNTWLDSDKQNLIETWGVPTIYGAMGYILTRILC